MILISMLISVNFNVDDRILNQSFTVNIFVANIVTVVYTKKAFFGLPRTLYIDKGPFVISNIDFPRFRIGFSLRNYNRTLELVLDRSLS